MFRLQSWKLKDLSIAISIIKGSFRSFWYFYSLDFPIYLSFFDSANCTSQRPILSRFLWIPYPIRRVFSQGSSKSRNDSDRCFLHVYLESSSRTNADHNRFVLSLIISLNYHVFREIYKRPNAFINKLLLHINY